MPKIRVINKLMPKFQPIIALLLISIVVIGVAYVLLAIGVIKNPFSKKLEVPLKSAYQNPFDQKTQYVNPFSEYKNPFDYLQ